MYEFKDLARLTSVATVFVVIFGAVDFLSSVTDFIQGLRSRVHSIWPVC
jgi:hypothetical protein